MRLYDLYNNINLRVELSGELAEKFEWLKNYLGLRNNSEVVWRILSEAYHRAQGELKEVPS